MHEADGGFKVAENDHDSDGGCGAFLFLCRDAGDGP